MSFSLTVPREPLARFRLLALWFALLVTIGNAVAIPLMSELAGARMIAAVAASLLLGAWWSFGYKRGEFPVAGWLLEPLLLVMVAVSSPMPLRSLGVFYAGVQLRALYVSRAQLPVLLIVYAAARFAVLWFAPLPGPYGPLTGTTAIQIIALSVIAVSLYAFVGALARQAIVERELLRSDERYRLVAAATRDVFYDVDLATGTIEWSESMLPVFGYYPQEVGRDLTWWIERVHPDDRPGLEELVRAFSADPTRRVDSYRYRVARADGSYAHVSGNALIQRDGNSPPTRVIGAIRDVTVETQLAEQLRQSQKMEAVGQLAGGVAHDFNNLLTVIGGHVYMLEHHVPHTDVVERHLTGITRTVDRAAALTRQLLAFSRRQLLKPAVLNVNAVVDEVVQMVRPAVGAQVTIETHLDPLLAPVLADSGQLVQMLVNLSLNAKDAMPSGGTLTIETSNVTLHADDAESVASSLQAGDYVRLVVRDTGVGMTPTTLARAFEPFFTTKQPGSGTGLGLATAYGIAKQSMGDIRAESRPGEGATFIVLLPAVRRDAQAPDEEGDAPRPAARPSSEQRVLLVEDDDGVRDFAREVLADAGYTVIEARNGVDALAVARDVLPSIDLVVTDVVMPRMGGREMVATLRRDRPDVPVLYMTGYTDDARMLGELRDNEANLLTKPFGAQALARAVAHAAAR